MGCTKAQLLALLSYIENECREAGSYNKCMKAITVIKARVEELATSEALNMIFR